MMYIPKNNEPAFLKKPLGILFLIFTSLLIMGCSTNGTTEDEGSEAEGTADQSEQAILAVIEEEFNGPDEKYIAKWNAMEEAQVSEQYSEDYEAFLKSPEYQELMSYMEETYAPYFTENGYDNFINTTAAFTYSRFENDYELTPSNIEITQSENGETLYDFTFDVEYTDQNGESEQFNFEGNAIVPEEGKIGEIEYLDDLEDGLLEQLRSDEQK